MSNIIPTYNGAIPSFPQALSVNINYIDTPILIDLSTNLIQGKINGVQTAFIDLMDSEHDVELIMEDTKQRIYAKAGTSGYYPLLASQLMKFKTKAKGECNYNIIFINFPIALGVWGQVGEGNNPVPPPVEIITSGGGVPLITEDDVEQNKFMAASLIAGNNITLNSEGGAITINSTASGGGGGGTPDDKVFFNLGLFAEMGEINIPAKNSNPINIEDFYLDSNGNNSLISFTGDAIDFIRFNKSGWYRFDFKVSTSSLTGDNYLAVEFTGNGESSFSNIGFSTPTYFSVPDENSMSTPATGSLNIYIDANSTMKLFFTNVIDAITALELFVNVTPILLDE